MPIIGWIPIYIVQSIGITIILIMLLKTHNAFHTRALYHTRILKISIKSFKGFRNVRKSIEKSGDISVLWPITFLWGLEVLNPHGVHSTRDLQGVYFVDSYTDAHWFCRDRLCFWTNFAFPRTLYESKFHQRWVPRGSDTPANPRVWLGPVGVLCQALEACKFLIGDIPK